MKPKLLLLHGALGSKADLLPVRSSLNEGYECVTYEFPGHGSSPLGETSFQIDGFATALGDFVLSQKLEGCYVFGYSMGGYVAAKLQSEKSCFSAIYTLGTKFIWDAHAAAKEAGQLDANAIATRFPAYAAKLAEQHVALGWKVMLQKTAQMMVELGQMPIMTLEDFEKIQIPLAVGLGDRDKMVPLSDAVAIYQKAPKGCLDVLPYTPHPLDKVNLQLLAARLNAFFLANN